MTLIPGVDRAVARLTEAAFLCPIEMPASSMRPLHALQSWSTTWNQPSIGYWQRIRIPDRPVARVLGKPCVAYCCGSGPLKWPFHTPTRGSNLECHMALADRVMTGAHGRLRVMRRNISRSLIVLPFERHTGSGGSAGSEGER